MTKRFSVPLDDATAAAVQAAAGTGSVAGFLAALVRNEMLTQASAAVGAYEQAVDGEAYESDRLDGLADAG